MFWKLFSLLSVSFAFLTLIVWVYLPRNKTRFDDYGSIPLQTDLLARSDEIASEKNPPEENTPEENIMENR